MRADALQRDLDDTQDELAETKQKLAAAEAEKARLAEVVARVREQQPTEELPSANTTGARVAFLVLAMAAAIALIGLRSSSRSTPSVVLVDNPICTLRTDPPGAEIVSLCHDATPFETTRGRSPLALSRSTWIMNDAICRGSMIARLPGYIDTPVEIPLGCDDTVVHLRPATVEAGAP